MAGYPGSGGGYPGAGGQQGGYPGGASAPPGGGYPGSGGGYPGSGGGGYPGSGGGGYPGSGGGGYPGSGGGGGGYPGSGGGGYPGSGGGYPGSGGGYPGGGAASAAAPPPSQSAGFQGYPGSTPAVDPVVAQWFNAVDSDRSGQITAKELQRALVNGNWSHFSEEACRMMIEMFDRNNKGTISIHEFADLFRYINQWKGTFEGIDRDRSGYIEFNELVQDLYDSNSSGSIDINEFQQLFNCINQWKSVFQGYDTDKSGAVELAEMTKAFQQMGYRFTPTFVQNLLAKFDSRTHKLTLDNFIVACVQIKRLTDGFRVRDREQRGQATMQYEDFVGLAMGIHR